MTGVGKSYFACALGQLACRLGFRAMYKRAPIENWHDYIAHPTIADAVLDRLVHNGLQGQNERSLTSKGESSIAHQPEPRPVAPITMPDRSDHDAAIQVMTMGAMAVDR